jgi:hypothetical protein
MPKWLNAVYLVAALILGTYMGSAYRFANSTASTGGHETSQPNSEDKNGQGAPPTPLSDPIVLCNLALVFLNGFLAFGTMRSANAAKDAADALPTLERAYVFVSVKDHGVTIQRQELISSVNPDGSYITTLAEAVHRGKVWLWFENHGKTPAILRRIEFKITRAGPGTYPPAIDPGVTPGRILPAGVVATEGHPFPEGLKWKKVPIKDDDILSRADFLWVIGFIRYQDIFGNNHITGFGFRYDIVSEKFVMLGNEKYNYRRAEDASEIPPTAPEIAKTEFTT